MRRRFMNESKIDFDYNDYMTIEALEDNVEIYLPRVSEYGINGIGWTKYRNKIVVNSGDFISIKYTLNKGEAYGVISINGKCNLRGNCNSLIFGDYASSHNDLSEYGNCFRGLLKDNSGVQEVDINFLLATKLANYCYNDMFRGCTSLTTAPELPATTLADSCYRSMFGDCTRLTTAPALPATTLAKGCYNGMFMQCTSLTTAPELPATTLADLCYSSMFQDCTSLTTAPELPVTKLEDRCYSSMFSGCTNLTTATELPATTLKSYCYAGMFMGCRNLTTAPELPATTLAESCYDGIFMHCLSLTTAPELPVTALASNCYRNMFLGCTSLTVAPELPATALASNCYNSMFYGCKKLTTAPELPATTLANYCYNTMFRGCTKLNYIKMLATDISASDCLYNWVNGVASTGTFVKNPAMTSLPTGTSGIPSGWTVVNDGEESGENTIPNNQIHYTSIDNAIVYPYYKTGFGANIVSNTNENGLGIITFDGDITTFESYVYANIEDLTSIIIPNSVTLIEFNAFEWCTQLTRVTIGEGVTEIGAFAFYYCESLSSVYCKAKTPPSIGNKAFGNVSGRKIYVPMESVDAYRVAEGWIDYANDIVGYNF